MILNNTIETDNFSKIYPKISNFLLKNGRQINSRNGACYEVDGFTTVLTDPAKRCVGIGSRNMNVFFLLAESIWIWCGKRDLKTLNIFNSQMRAYSDDGVYFNAPYGWRMRNHGVDSMIPEKEESQHHLYAGYDQIRFVIHLLKSDPETRRAVVQIWDPSFDLFHQDKKDMACNTQVFFKIRDEKLNLSVLNRSNDLHWGLTTNIFQFSMIGEIMASILGIELGVERHFSDSLHAYESNIHTKRMADVFRSHTTAPKNVYDFSRPMNMDFNFISNDRFFEVDQCLKLILKLIQTKAFEKGSDENQIKESEKAILKFSKFFYGVYLLLKTFCEYKICIDKDDRVKVYYYNKLESLFSYLDMVDWDMYLMARNYFASRITGNSILRGRNEGLF